jgi:endonuclease/exonuclease/phosphatase family metal-dependent hydrolase
MTIVLAALLSLFRLTGFFFEPQLSVREIHAVAGEPLRVTWPLADHRPRRIVTWNIERGVKFDRIAAVLAELDADVVLLQEADRFCNRSEGRDVPRELAVALRMNFVIGGEFQEIGEGNSRRACVSGQAILSRLPIDEPVTIRFADQAPLKWRWNPAQPRRGGRVALRARVADAVFYSVHLESGGDERRRENQLRDIVRDAAARDGAVVVGGDFNNDGPRDSAMFTPLRAAAFVNTMSREGQAARRPIDWIFTRNMPGMATPVPAGGASDHDPVLLLRTVQQRF